MMPFRNNQNHMMGHPMYIVEVEHFEYDVEQFDSLEDAVEYIKDVRSDVENLPMCEVNIILSVQEVISHQTI